MIEGPVTGGGHGWAFGRPLFDLAAHGYVEAEYFLSGEATTYRQVPGTDWGRDGHWRAEAKASAPFKTRILVYRPADPARFNHTVIVNWNNVTAGYELFSGESAEILEGGYAFVAATVQRVGVHGFAANNQGLAAWDPQRYGTLSIPTDDASYDIFTQVARAVGPGRDRTGVDPLAGLDVRKVIGIGASQSAGRLATYVNAIQPLEHAFDGFLLQIYFGRGTPLEVGPTIVNVDMSAPRASADLEALVRETGLHRRQPDPGRSRHSGDGGQFRAGGDRLPRRAPARHRPLPLLGVGGHQPRRARCLAGAVREVPARVRGARCRSWKR